MDVTPQLIEQIDFSEKFRGYDPDQVDDFLERVGATIAELNNAVRDANIRAERAELTARNAETAARDAQSAAPPAPVVATMTDEEAATTAARTLMLAQRTADDLLAAATADADQLRSEAQLVHDTAARDAEAEAAGVLAQAQASAEGLLTQARHDAEAELVTRRDEIAAEIAELDQRRTVLLGDVVTIETRLDGYRDSLDRVHGAIRSLLDDPNALRTQPPLDIEDAPPVVATPFVDATAQEWENGSAATSDSGGSFGSAAATETPEPMGFGSFDASAATDAFTEIPPIVESGAFELGSIGGIDEVSPVPATALTEPADESIAEWQPEPTRAFHAVDSEPSTAHEPVVDEPWGPGSWSTMVGETESTPIGTDLWDDGALIPASGPLPVAEYVPLPAEPTMDDTFGASQSDRFMRDLDEAVNQPQTAEVDEAMTAFFEGDDEPATTTRRFRRR